MEAPLLLPSKQNGKPVKVGSVKGLAQTGESPEAPVQKPPNVEKIPCKHEKLTVSCGHSGKRGFTLQLPAPAVSPRGGEDEEAEEGGERASSK